MAKIESMAISAISPFYEMGAYEALWSKSDASFKNIAAKLSEPSADRPSQHVLTSIAEQFAKLAIELLKKAGISRFGLRIRGSAEYPIGLNDAAHPLPLLYFRGWWEHFDTEAIAIVGTRKPSKAGIIATELLIKDLVKRYEMTIVSGLADGIDTIAHNSAMANNGRTIAVLGTPIHEAFPVFNKVLMQTIAEQHLLVSQVPIYRWANSPYPSRKFFFPERNITMSALTKATVIMEAGETSGTLIQARAALAQGRKLFLHETCFQNKSLEWPARFLEKGAIKISSATEISEHLKTC